MKKTIINFNKDESDVLEDLAALERSVSPSYFAVSIENLEKIINVWDFIPENSRFFLVEQILDLQLQSDTLINLLNTIKIHRIASFKLASYIAESGCFTIKQLVDLIFGNDDKMDNLIGDISELYLNNDTFVEEVVNRISIDAKSNDPEVQKIANTVFYILSSKAEDQQDVSIDNIVKILSCGSNFAPNKIVVSQQFNLLQKLMGMDPSLSHILKACASIQPQYVSQSLALIGYINSQNFYTDDQIASAVSDLSDIEKERLADYLLPDRIYPDSFTTSLPGVITGLFAASMMGVPLDESLKRRAGIIFSALRNRDFSGYPPYELGNKPVEVKNIINPMERN